MKQKQYKAVKTLFLSVSLILTICTLLFQGVAWAQDFPNREIEMVISYAPGGSTDMMARIVGDKVSKILKVPINYNNKPGAGGSITINYVANAKPDGYTIGTGGTTNMGILLATSDKMPYTINDLSGVARGVILPLVIYTKKGRLDNFAALVKEEKQKPGSLTFGSYGAKSSPHLLGEMLNLAVGMQMRHIPFDGDAKVFTAVLGGHVDVGTGTPATILSNLKAGTITALAVSSGTRMEAFPDVPTVKELGYPEATFVAYDGFVIGSKVPKDRQAIIQSAFEKSLNDPEVQAALKKTGQLPGFLNGKDYDSFMASTFESLKKTAIKAGLKE